MLSFTLLLLLGLLAISVPVAAVMGVLGLALNDFFAVMPLQRAMGEIIWNECGMARNADGLKRAIAKIPEMREEL